MAANQPPTTATLGVIIGNRDFFPDVLVGEARRDFQKLFDSAGIRPIWLSPEQSKLGGVETYAEARKCADLFSAHRRDISGVLVVLPNFGDEKGVADPLKVPVLNVPFLVEAPPADLTPLGLDGRRDA